MKNTAQPVGQPTQPASKYCVKPRDTDGSMCIFPARVNVVIAEFSKGTHVDARNIGRMLDAAPDLLAACEEILAHADERHALECSAISALVPCDCCLSRARAAIAKARP